MKKILAQIIKVILSILLVMIIVCAGLIFYVYLKNPNFVKSSGLVLKGAIYSAINLEDKAIEIYKRAGKINSSNPIVYDAMARSYARLEQWGKAIAYLKKGIENVPEEERFYKLIFYYYMSEDLNKEAKEYFEELLKKNPTNKLVAKYLRLIKGLEAFGGLDKKSKDGR